MKKLLSIGLGVMLFMSSIGISSADESINIGRVSGYDRYETALNVSRNNFEHCDYVVIASGEIYADALSGGSLTTQTRSPILLTKKDYISESVLDEISRLEPSRIFLLGGEMSISNNVLNRIRSYTGIEAERIFGQNRSETNAKINELRTDLFTGEYEVTSNNFIYVDGYNFYDSLYAAPYIGYDTGDSISYLVLNNGPLRESEFDRPILNSIGDFQIIKDDPREPIEFHLNTKGRNRYESSTLIAEQYGFNVDTAILVSGEDYPDGLSASSLVALYHAPVLLTPKNRLDYSTREYIKKAGLENIIIVGGEKSVSKDVENELRNLYLK